MDRVTSKDGTPIAFDRQGDGPAVILVGGGFVDRSENAPLATELAERFSTYNYDRRGRGDSGDTPPYAVEREIEDIEAVIAEAGGRAHLYGPSSGGALVLEAAAAGVAADRVAVYEVPYDMAEGGPERHRAYTDQLSRLLAEGSRGDAAALFMGIAGASGEMIEQARRSELWPGLEAIAHTLAYDAACLGDGRPPAARLAAHHPAGAGRDGRGEPGLVRGRWRELLRPGRRRDRRGRPGAERRVIEGQDHMADPKVIAAVLGEFFTA